MDIFNKKKVKKLEEENSCLKDEINMYKINEAELKEVINTLKNDKNKQRDSFEKIRSQDYQENQKLLDWIEKILDTIGTMEVSEKENFRIPVCRECSIPKISEDFIPFQATKEVITIPSITIIKFS